MIVKHYIGALLNPLGRLPRDSFIVMSILLAVAYVAANALVRTGAGAWGFEIALVLLVMWMKFSIASRRMHDVGRSNVLAVGLFLIAAISYLACIDPTLLGDDEETQETWFVAFSWLWSILRLVFLIAMIELWTQDGNSGPNAHGPEFGRDGMAYELRTNARTALGEAISAGQGTARIGDFVARAPRSATQGGVIVPKAERQKPTSSGPRNFGRPR